MCLLLQCDDSVSNSMPDTRKGESETWKKQNIMCTLDHKRIPHITCTCIIQVYYNEHLLTIETLVTCTCTCTIKSPSSSF